MSLEVYVFLDRDLLPTASEWASAIRGAGFDVDMYADFDTKTHSGFLPCPDSHTGFEYYFEALTESMISDLNPSPAERSRLEFKNSIVSFVFKTDTDLKVVKAASYVLANISNGIIFDAEAGAIVETENILNWVNGAYSPAPWNSPENLETPRDIRSWERIHWFRWIQIIAILIFSVYLIITQIFK